MATNRNGERGSVSPVFITLLTVVLLLLGAFLDREWLNYKLYLAEETADFAAEAGARTAVVLDTVTVHRSQWHDDPPQPVCDDPPGADLNSGACITQHMEVSRTLVQHPIVLTDVEEHQLLREWKSLADCGASPEPPSYQCGTVEVVGRRITYPPEMFGLVDQVFRANWFDQSSARVSETNVSADASNQQILMTVTLQMGSITGLMGWHQPAVVAGSAATQMQPLVFQ